MPTVPVTIAVANNQITSARFGRNDTPYLAADAGVRASFDRAITAYDGSVQGPLLSGDYRLDQAADTLIHVLPPLRVVRDVRDSDVPDDLVRDTDLGPRRICGLERGAANDIAVVLALAAIALADEVAR